jgi:ribosomal protein S18 acetylase RimI-like enzyme
VRAAGAHPDPTRVRRAGADPSAMMEGMTERTEIDIRAATAADHAAVVRVLSEAFADDPVFSWIYPDPATRAAVLPGFFALFAEHSSRLDGDLIAGDGHGAAVWVPPGESLVAPEHEEAFGVAIVGLSPGDAERLVASDEVFEAAHPTEPHWYLSLLGVADAHQGRGVGSALLRAATERSDRAGMPSYLEATKAENRRLYERHGFVVTDELRLPDGPPVWAMWREARA